ncbi:MAG: ABC transporter ATP-binding protein, partial [Oscillospiraceae bacterium]|nr:ABC transporter ATP-binding protein [Oscillospiraceae bacterium]
NMMAFTQYATHIIMSFMVISMVFITMPRAMVSAKRIGEVMNSEVLIQNRPDATDAGKLKGEIRFEDVSFTYPGGEAPALNHISFTAAPGDTVALIGSTGSGKSTLINLIPRLYDVTEGKITVDGIDIRDFTKESLRQNIGFVPQKNVLFSGTVESNLKYGCDEADADDANMKKAAAIAQATEFIESKPDGYQSEIAQGGGNVSGGQKQRLAIARALNRNCPIYVFDDSFSALDFKTDAQLRRALKENTADATVLIVAQRVGTIMGADRIIVMNDGEIVGMGTHRELLKNCQVYADIAHSQLSEEELA